MAVAVAIARGLPEAGRATSDLAVATAPVVAAAPCPSVPRSGPAVPTTAVGPAPAPAAAQAAVALALRQAPPPRQRRRGGTTSRRALV